MATSPIDFSIESITTGVVRYNDLAYLLVTINELVNENVPFSRIYELDCGDWDWDDVEWLACSATVCHKPNERFLALSQRGGHLFRIGDGEAEFESLTACQNGFIRKPGLMREIREIDGYAYAVGTGRQAYRRESADNWVCIDKWSQVDSMELTDYSFESIDGFSANDIYAVGWRGEIWHYDGKNWREIKSPTNLTLHKVKCINDTVYIVGKEGIILRGRNDSWDFVKQDETSSDIWDIVFFNDRIFVSTTNFLYVLEDDDLKLVDFGDTEIPSSCYHLSAADGILWSIGATDVLQFDGVTWGRIV